MLRQSVEAGLTGLNASTGYAAATVILVLFLLYRYVLRTPFPPRDLKGRPVPWIHPGMLVRLPHNRPAWCNVKRLRVGTFHSLYIPAPPLSLQTKFGDFWAETIDPLGEAERFAKAQEKSGDLVYLGGLGGGGLRPAFTVFGKENVRKLLGHSVSIKNSTRNIGGVFPIWDKMFGKGLFMIHGNQWKRTHKICLRAMGSIHRESFFPHV